ncbi:DUF3090 family protein [Jatrophihabitans telluris]|uniref:DUF3090 family protein n=1 Tax=Jatrophihabitans telluris TaxID=2038343 RepID=A0ABY4QRP6_9ACTN|nr:DUF3090 family protein [Jatrophihabitans telluris]UQX86636.1 DUF3090 family protein [Jatrophihabitans telluris]
MSRQLFFFDQPRRFVVGTVGQPGERVFFLQASDDTRTVSVALEKSQVTILTERLEQLLEEVATRSGIPVPEAVDVDAEPLENPIDEEFRVAAMGLAYDTESGMIIIEAQAPAESTETAEATLLEDTEEGPDALRVRLAHQAAFEFAERAKRVVAAGRPPCPLCNEPMDPNGHVCPRQNGYHRQAEIEL